MNLKEEIYNIVKMIPEGKTMSYKDVAKRAGVPRAWRAVGNILNKNYSPEIPCHRVIKSNGKFGGYNRGMDKKRELLERERNVQER